MKSFIVQWFAGHRLFWLLAALNTFMWSWLFLVDNSRLSNSAFTAYLATTLGFVIIILIATTCFCYIIRYLLRCVKKTKNPLIVLKIFFVWAFVELLISWLVAVVWMGRGGSWNTVLPFSSLAPYLAWTPLRFLSRFVGYYGLSSVAVTGLFIIGSKKLRRYLLVYIGVIVVLTTMAWAFYKTPHGAPLTATIVAERLGSPTRVAAGMSQLVVLPEYGLDGYTSVTVASRFKANHNIYFVGSAQQPTSQGSDNTLIFGDTNHGFLRQEQKSRLIPGGEYLPLGPEIGLKLFAPSTYSNFEVTRAVIKGHDGLTPFRIDTHTVVGSAACSSIISMEDYRSLVRQGATVLTNSASLEIFRGSRLFNWQHRGLAKFMAVANARPLLQSSNNWPAFALDQNAHQLAQVQPVGSTQVVMTTNTQKTLYSILGEWVAYAGGVWLAADALMWLRTRKASKRI